VTITELVGWEHSMKNELIIAEFKHVAGNPARARAQAKLNEMADMFGLNSIARWASS
jgi:hypothetical protein